MKLLCILAVAVAGTLAAASAHAVEVEVNPFGIYSLELKRATSSTYATGDLHITLALPFYLPYGVHCAGYSNLFVLKAVDDPGGRARTLIQSAMRSGKMIGLRLIEEANAPCSVMAAGIFNG